MRPSYLLHFSRGDTGNRGGGAGGEQKSGPVHNSMHTFFSIVYYNNREIGSTDSGIVPIITYIWRIITSPHIHNIRDIC